MNKIEKYLEVEKGYPYPDSKNKSKPEVPDKSLLKLSVMTCPKCQGYMMINDSLTVWTCINCFHTIYHSEIEKEISLRKNSISLEHLENIALGEESDDNS